VERDAVTGLFGFSLSQVEDSRVFVVACSGDGLKVGDEVVNANSTSKRDATLPLAEDKPVDAEAINREGEGVAKMGFDEIGIILREAPRAQMQVESCSQLTR
jgi:hypothetical protein